MTTRGGAGPEQDRRHDRRHAFERETGQLAQLLHVLLSETDHGKTQEVVAEPPLHRVLEARMAVDKPGRVRGTEIVARLLQPFSAPGAIAAHRDPGPAWLASAPAAC